MAKKKLPSKTLKRLNGDGSFRFNASGTLEYRFSYKDENGKSKRKSVTGENEQECYERADAFRKLMQKKRRGLDLGDTLVTILEKRYRLDYEMNYIGESTYNRDLTLIQVLEKSFIGNIPVVELTKDQVLAYLVSLTNYSGSVILKLYRQVKLAYRIAYENKLVDYNFMNDRDMRCPRSSKPTKKVKALTVEEQRKLIETMVNNKPPKGRNDMRTQLFIEMFSGMRMGEINALRAGDIDLESGIIHVSSTVSRGLGYESKVKDCTKTSAGQRDIPISDMLRPYIQRALDNMVENPDDLLFLDCNTKKVLDTKTVNLYLQRISEKAGIPFYGQHALRHTFATRCIESGVDPVVLKTWLGHRDIHTTLDTYTDVFENMNNGAIQQFDDYMKGI